MKKISLILIFYSLLTQFSFSQYAKNDRELYGLKGNVKTVVKESAKIIFESGKYVEKNRKKWRTETYDLKGDLVAEDPVPPQEGRPLVCFNGKCNTEEPQRKLTYNKQNKVVLEEDVLKDGTVTSKTEYDYDYKGRLFEWRFYYLNAKDELYLAGKWVYKRTGDTVRATLYDGCCTIKRWRVTSYNEHRDINETASFKGDGSLIYRTRYDYEYDDRDNWIKQINSSWVTKDGKSFFEPVEANYRTIAYY